MPEPTTTTAAVVATASVTGATLTGVGLAAGVPLPVIICAVLGATIAVSRGSRVELTPAGLWSALLTFALSLAMGVVAGPLFGAAIERAAEKFVGLSIAGLGANALCALLLALLGQSVILPAVSKRLGVEIETRGGNP